MNAVTLKIKRFDPEKDQRPYWATYQVKVETNERLLDALHRIKWEHDGSLTFRRSCGHGVCGSDAMRINGLNRLACKVLMRDVGERVTIEPLLAFPVIKDLVVDLEPFFTQYEKIKPYLINDEPPPLTERLQTPEQRARIVAGTKCILCAACTTSCPVTWSDPAWVGPAAIVNAHRFIFDSRDQGAAERLGILSDRFGAFRCRTVFNCTECCPRGIPVTDLIEQVKQQHIPVKVYHTDERLMVAAPIAGLEPEDIVVEVTADGRLLLHGDLRGLRKEAKELLLDEWSVGIYHRELALPVPVNGNCANVTYSNGVLTVVLPISEQPSPARLTLERVAPAHGERKGNAGHPPTGIEA